MTTPFWLDNPSILFNTDEINKIWPSADMSFESKLNAITRIVILFTVLGFLISKNIKILISGIVTLGAIVLLFITNKKKESKKENFKNMDIYNIVKGEFTQPTTSNPSMNVLLPEIQDDPSRNKAAPAFNPLVENEMNNKTKELIVNNFDDTTTIDERLFKDLGDNFSFDQSMRAWHPMPNTTIPNDQKSFGEFCYGDMVSCRDVTDNELGCTRNMPPRWTNY